MKSEKKNWFRRHWILSTILGFFILLILIGIFVGDDSSNNEINTNLEQNKKQSESPIREEKRTYSNTRAGVTLILEDYKFKKLGENYGKFEEITFSLINEGSSSIFPDLYFEVIDLSKKFDKDKVSKEIKLTSYLQRGYSLVHETVPIDLTIGSLNNPKEIKLSVYDFSLYGDFVVAVNMRTNFSEGFK